MGLPVAMIRIYYSKRFKTYLYQLSILFLVGGISSLLVHRKDYIFITKGLADVRDANKKLAEIKKMSLLDEKWAKRYLSRGKALTENDKPTAREKRNKREFEKLERKYK